MSIFLSILGAISPYSTIILSVVGWIISLFGANSKNLAAYQKMIEQANGSTDLSVESKQLLDAHVAIIQAQIAAADAKAKALAEAAQQIADLKVRAASQPTPPTVMPNEKK